MEDLKKFRSVINALLALRRLVDAVKQSMTCDNEFVDMETTYFLALKGRNSLQ